MILVNGEEYEYRYFPDGTQLVRADYCKTSSTDPVVSVKWIYEFDEEFLTLYFLIRHIKEQEKKRVVLSIPYLPNARMDRVKAKNDIFTLKYFCDLINSLECEEVIVRDVHSNVSLALLNNVYGESMDRTYCRLFNEIANVSSNFIMYYLDEGASKRYSDILQKEYLFGVKERDWDTGKIKSVNVVGNIPKEPFDVVIVDDICSYGGTIYYSAKKLKELGADRIFVYVTHCENSVLYGKFGEEGLPLLDTGLIEKLYTTDSIFTKQHSRIEIIK